MTFTNVESIRTATIRTVVADVSALAKDIKQNGLRHPLVLWSDGTLLSGSRRLLAHMTLKRPAVDVEFVSTIEEAAKLIQRDNEDDYLAKPMKWSEVCRLWDLLRRFDAPAAARRADANRRAGVELRRQTRAGLRRPGRENTRGENYFLSVMAPPFGISEATGQRVYSAWNIARGGNEVSDERRELARQVMADIDEHGNVWANYRRLLGQRSAPPVFPKGHRPPVQRDPAPAKRQHEAYERALPQLEGLMVGLVELGAPHPDLTWEAIGPWHARLAAVRREMERIIRQMKERNES